MNLHLEPDSLRIAIPFPDEIRCAGNHGHDKRSPLRGIARSGCQREVDTPGLEPSKKGGSVGLEQIVRQVGANQIIFCLDHTV